MTKKLFEVHVEFTYYALGETREDAEGLVSDAFSDKDWSAIAFANEVTHADWYCDGSRDQLIYGIDKDTTLDQALAAQGLPSASEIMTMSKAVAEAAEHTGALPAPAGGK